MSIPFIGSKASVITTSSIRYEGTLSYVDIEDWTISLTFVKTFGTESRPCKRHMPAAENVFEKVVFKINEIEQLNISNIPRNTDASSLLSQDPAIVSVFTSPEKEIKKEPETEPSSPNSKLVEYSELSRATEEYILEDDSEHSGDEGSEGSVHEELALSEPVHLIPLPAQPHPSSSSSYEVKEEVIAEEDIYYTVSQRPSPPARKRDSLDCQEGPSDKRWRVGSSWKPEIQERIDKILDKIHGLSTPKKRIEEPEIIIDNVVEKPPLVIKSILKSTDRPRSSSNNESYKFYFCNVAADHKWDYGVLENLGRINDFSPKDVSSTRLSFKRTRFIQSFLVESEREKRNVEALIDSSEWCENWDVKNESTFFWTYFDPDVLYRLMLLATKYRQDDLSLDWEFAIEQANSIRTIKSCLIDKKVYDAMTEDLNFCGFREWQRIMEWCGMTREGLQFAWEEQSPR
ncbi:hypothetical protein CAEBREN_09943 [Caenorhabditis brenneri]|uniref:Lsm14-like N-terminal domain-containing protein n=1 Tax=Caenorhabditis brenneri TaxID=135651 RepID=G0P6I4_CAEBE|nr:hypothetical protein CAEBREN_09943 [Caenorhabditis brenneri]